MDSWPLELALVQDARTPAAVRLRVWRQLHALSRAQRAGIVADVWREALRGESEWPVIAAVCEAAVAGGEREAVLGYAAQLEDEDVALFVTLTANDPSRRCEVVLAACSSREGRERYARVLEQSCGSQPLDEAFARCGLGHDAGADAVVASCITPDALAWGSAGGLRLLRDDPLVVEALVRRIAREPESHARWQLVACLAWLTPDEQSRALIQLVAPAGRDGARCRMALGEAAVAGTCEDRVGTPGCVCVREALEAWAERREWQPGHDAPEARYWAAMGINAGWVRYGDTSGVSTERFAGTIDELVWITEMVTEAVWNPHLTCEQRVRAMRVASCEAAHGWLAANLGASPVEVAAAVARLVTYDTAWAMKGAEAYLARPAAERAEILRCLDVREVRLLAAAHELVRRDTGALAHVPATLAGEVGELDALVAWVHDELAGDLDAWDAFVAIVESPMLSLRAMVDAAKAV